MSILKGTEARDPSLALCSICANARDGKVYAESMDGQIRVYRTCMRYVSRDCNDFVPNNIGAGSSLRQIAETMAKNAQYGRF